MYIDHDKKMVFIHIPRTGGTSIKSALNLHDKIYKEDVYHMSANDIPKKYNDYFKFTFVRNPFDRFVSLYFYNKSEHYKEMFPDKLTTKVAEKYNFKEWLDNFRYKHIQQVDFGLDKVDFVGKYENLQKDLNLQFNVKIEKENFTNHKHYSHYYDEESILKVSKISSKDIEVYSYCYEEDK
jgi:chondroitin 4-sulfotransferase 11